jgi:predicted nucleic acid-binding protein
VTGDLILDTSAVVAHLRGKPEATAPMRRALEEDRTLYLPLTAWGELLYGAYHGEREARKLANLEEFARVTVRLLPNERTAEAYARAKQALGEHRGNDPRKRPVDRGLRAGAWLASGGPRRTF